MYIPHLEITPRDLFPCFFINFYVIFFLLMAQKSLETNEAAVAFEWKWFDTFWGIRHTGSYWYHWLEPIYKFQAPLHHCCIRGTSGYICHCCTNGNSDREGEGILEDDLEKYYDKDNMIITHRAYTIFVPVFCVVTVCNFQLNTGNTLYSVVRLLQQQWHGRCEWKRWLKELLNLPNHPRISHNVHVNVQRPPIYQPWILPSQKIAHNDIDIL